MNIKEEVIHNKLTYKELLELYIKYQKENNKKSVPQLEKDYKYYINNSDCNCYAYALRLKMPKYFSRAFYQALKTTFDIDPGVISGIEDISTPKKLLNAIYSDLDTLNIDYSTVLNNNNQYKVAVYQDVNSPYTSKEYPPEYHFWRKNKEGIWTCKQGYEGIIEKSYIHTANKGHKLIKVLDIKTK